MPSPASSTICADRGPWSSRAFPMVCLSHRERDFVNDPPVPLASSLALAAAERQAGPPTATAGGPALPTASVSRHDTVETASCGELWGHSRACGPRYGVRERHLGQVLVCFAMHTTTSRSWTFACTGRFGSAAKRPVLRGMGTRFVTVTAVRFAKPPRSGCRPGADMRSSPCARVCLRGALRAPSCAKRDQTPRYMSQNRRLWGRSGPRKASTTTLSSALWRVRFASHNSYTKIITQNPVPERECGFKSHLRHHRLWLHRAISEIVAGTPTLPVGPDLALSAGICRHRRARPTAPKQH